jgi:hypothetical protein
MLRIWLRPHPLIKNCWHVYNPPLATIKAKSKDMRHKNLTGNKKATVAAGSFPEPVTPAPESRKALRIFIEDTKRLSLGACRRKPNLTMRL